MIWTVRNDVRIPLHRRSSDSAWPLLRADGTPFHAASNGAKQPATEAIGGERITR